MCSANVRSVINSIVSSKVSSNELFTAFEISLLVQNYLKSQQIFDSTEHRHQILRNDVHQEINRHLVAGTYDRNSQDVGAPTDAFVYFPIGADPSTYVPLKRKDAPVVSANPFVIDTSVKVSTPVYSVNAAPAPDVDDGDGRKPDARGTVCVPNHLLRSAGFTPGDTAFVFAANHKWNGSGVSQKTLMLAKDLPIGCTSLTSYTVDVNSNVRITQSTFVASGLIGKTYEFDVDANNKIVLVKPS